MIMFTICVSFLQVCIFTFAYKRIVYSVSTYMCMTAPGTTLQVGGRGAGLGVFLFRYNTGPLYQMPW